MFILILLYDLLAYIMLFHLFIFHSKIHSDTPPNDTPAADGEEATDAAPGGLTDADISSNWDEIVETFDAMELPEELLRGIYSYGFEKPSAIQQRAIRPTISGRDLIAQAQSGTVSFLIYLL
jgi:hypothetical protein